MQFSFRYDHADANVDKLKLTNVSTLTSGKLNVESFHSGERFLPMSNIGCVTVSMRSYVLLA